MRCVEAIFFFSSSLAPALKHRITIRFRCLLPSSWLEQEKMSSSSSRVEVTGSRWDWQRRIELSRSHRINNKWKTLQWMPVGIHEYK